MNIKIMEGELSVSSEMFFKEGRIILIILTSFRCFGWNCFEGRLIPISDTKNKICVKAT